MRNICCCLLILFCCTFVFSCSKNGTYNRDIGHLREKDFYLVIKDEETQSDVVFARKGDVYYCSTKDRIYLAKKDCCEYLSKKTNKIHQENGDYYHMLFSEVFEELRVHTVEQKDGQTMVSCWWGDGKRRTERYVLIYQDGSMSAIGTYDTPQSPLKTSQVLEWHPSVPADFRFELPKE